MSDPWSQYCSSSLRLTKLKRNFQEVMETPKNTLHDEREKLMKRMRVAKELVHPDTDIICTPYKDSDGQQYWIRHTLTERCKPLNRKNLTEAIDALELRDWTSVLAEEEDTEEELGALLNRVVHQKFDIIHTSSRELLSVTKSKPRKATIIEEVDVMAFMEATNESKKLRKEMQEVKKRVTHEMKESEQLVREMMVSEGAKLKPVKLKLRSPDNTVEECAYNIEMKDVSQRIPLKKVGLEHLLESAIATALTLLGISETTPTSMFSITENQFETIKSHVKANLEVLLREYDEDEKNHETVSKLQLRREKTASLQV